MPSPLLESPHSQTSTAPDEEEEEESLEELMDLLSFVDGNIEEHRAAIESYKQDRRNVMLKIVTKIHTREDIIAMTQSQKVTKIENTEVIIYDGHVHFDSYYWLPQFKILIKAKIPIGHSFLTENDIPATNERRDWLLLKDFVTFELFDL